MEAVGIAVIDYDCVTTQAFELTASPTIFRAMKRSEIGVDFLEHFPHSVCHCITLHCVVRHCVDVSELSTHSSVNVFVGGQGIWLTKSIHILYNGTFRCYVI